MRARIRRTISFVAGSVSGAYEASCATSSSTRGSSAAALPTTSVTRPTDLAVHAKLVDEPLRRRREVDELGDVRHGDGRVGRAADHDGLDRRVLVRPAADLRDAVVHGEGQRISRGGTVDDDPERAGAAL